MQARVNTKINKLLSSAGWSLFIVFVWEIVEEGLESLIAFALSSAVAVFVTKAISTLAIVGTTQGIKVSVKRFVFPLIKQITNKGGNDKMKWLINTLKFIWANKFTIIEMIVGGVIGYFGAYYLALEYLIVPVWGYYAVAGLTAFVVAFLAIYLGIETIAKYVQRIAVSKLDKNDQKKIDAIILDVLTKANYIKEQAVKLEQAKEQAKAELIAKQEAEIEALAKKKLEEN